MREPATDTETERLTKFVDKINKLLDDYRSMKYVRDRIDEFYYMQKREELKVLHGQIEEEKRQLDVLAERYEAKYKKLFMQWQKDARWLERDKVSQAAGAEVSEPPTTLTEVDLTRIKKCEARP